MLLGTYEHNLDDKFRLTIPSKLRNKLGETVYVSKGFEGCLEIRSNDAFDAWYKEISSHSNTSSDTRLLMREILANSSEIEFDKAGRIKIPGNILTLANVSKSVIILGLGDKIEIWDTEAYKEYTQRNAEQLETVANRMGGAQ